MEVDPRHRVVSLLSSARLNVRPYRGLIFLCGGKFDVESTTPISVRDALLLRLHSNESISGRIRLAEEIKDWNAGGAYSNLVTFEEHLAQLASLIVLVLESAGAIAELGLFAGIQEHQTKLLVVVDQGHYDQQTFIRLGLISFLEEEIKNKAEVYRWYKQNGVRAEFCANTATQAASDVAETVLQRAAQPHGGGVFNPENWLHRALLALELVGLCLALEVHEISEYLSAFGLATNPAELRQMLFMLERLGFLKRVAQGGMRLYLREGQTRFFDFGLKKAEFDWDRSQIEISLFYKSKDKKRFRVITQEMSG